MFQVCKTDADMTNNECVFENRSFDIAETVMAICFTESAGQQDYLVYNTETQDVPAYCFSSRTASNLGLH